MVGRPKKRCVNIDWLEVYVLEDNNRFPCNADYYRKQGYLVKERPYGTRVYKEMFEIVDEMNNPLIEIRRNPAAGESNFHGLSEFSSHIRLPNWVLYQGRPIDFLRDFLLKNGYIFKRIYRIDICYDFEYFDSGDQPARFVRRYIEGVYRKINQCRRATNGMDRWEGCEDNSISWGSRSSMVSTKLYNKTLELKEAKNDKPWIKAAWMVNDLIDNPCSMTKRDTKGNLYQPEIWRLEFSMKSEADGWIIWEMQNRKKVRKQAIPHRLEMFDDKEKIWRRFQNLAFHYFHFKYKEYIEDKRGASHYALASVHSDVEKRPQRKDRCRDKVLFRWDEDLEFATLSAAPAPSAKNNKNETLRRRLIEYKMMHPQPNIRMACDAILKQIEDIDKLRFVPLGDEKERMALQIALTMKLNGDTRAALEIIAEVKALLDNDLLL